MKTKYLIIFFAIALVFIILLLNPFSPKKPGKYSEFAKCLADSGLIMYGTDWCPHCQNQKEMFGKSFEFVSYINCDKNKETCLTEGVKGYPTWKFSGQSYTGTQQLETLSEITGCELPAE